MTGEATRPRWLPALGVLAPCALFAGLAALQWRFTIDDAWIVARYADNLADGAGWSFNPGERIEGTTTVLWTLLAWLAARLGAGGVGVLKAAGFACGLAAVAFVANRGLDGARRWEHPLAALALAAYVPHALWSVAGLETAGAGLLGMAGAWWVISPRRPRALAGACLLALAFLARPDAALFWLALPAVGLLRWALDGVRPGRALLEPLAVLIAAALVTSLWRQLEFGAWMPNTAITKTAEPLSEALAKGLPILRHWMGFQAFGVLVLLAVLGAAGRDPVRLGLAAVLLVWLAFLVSLGIPDQSYVYRFYAPLAPLVALLAAEGAIELGANLGPWGRRAIRLLLLVPVALLPSAFRQAWHAGEPHFRSVYSLGERVAGRRAAVAFARRIDELLPPDATMAISDAGIIPYIARRPVIDLFGLTDREIAVAIAEMKSARTPEEKERTQRAYADVILRREPDFFVHSFIAPPILEDPRWERCYRRVMLPGRYVFNERLGAEYALYARTCD